MHLCFRNVDMPHNIQCQHLDWVGSFSGESEQGHISLAQKVISRAEELHPPSFVKMTNCMYMEEMSKYREEM